MKNWESFCGSDAATSEWCQGGPNINAKQMRKNGTINENELEDVVEVDEGEHNSQVKETPQQIVAKDQGASSSNTTDKDETRRAKNAKTYIQTINAVASSIKQMAEAIDRKDEQAFINLSTLLNDIKAVEGLDENCV